MDFLQNYNKILDILIIYAQKCEPKLYFKTLFKDNNDIIDLFSDYLSLKFPSSFRDIYIRNINIFYYLLDVGLEDCVKIEKTDEDIR